MVYLFIPNLIGYARVLLVIAAFYFNASPALFFACYALSELLDAVDGYAARHFNQSTKYGAVLDMVTDRCSTAALMVLLANYYPTYMFDLMALIALDLTSHYAHLYVTLLKGEASHKSVDENTFLPIRLYYGNKYVLFTLCAANEAMFLLPYLAKHAPVHVPLIGVAVTYGQILVVWQYVVLPLGLAKQFMNLFQLIMAFKGLAEYDVAQHHGKESQQQPVKRGRGRSLGAHDASIKPEKTDSGNGQKHHDDDDSYHNGDADEEDDGSESRETVETRKMQAIHAAHEAAEAKGLTSPAKRTRRSLIHSH